MLKGNHQKSIHICDRRCSIWSNPSTFTDKCLYPTRPFSIPRDPQDLQLCSPENSITVHIGGLYSLWVCSQWRQPSMHWCFLGRRRKSARIWDPSQPVPCRGKHTCWLVFLFVPGERNPFKNSHIAAVGTGSPFIVLAIHYLDSIQHCRLDIDYHSISIWMKNQIFLFVCHEMGNPTTLEVPGYLPLFSSPST